MYMYIYIYICVCVYMYICIYIYIHTYIYMYIHICVCMYIHICISIYIYLCRCRSIYICTCLHVCYSHMYVCMIRLFVYTYLHDTYTTNTIYGGGTIDPWALRFLVVREIDCGDWLARRYMSAHQYCELFDPLAGRSDWVYHKPGNAPVPWSSTVSWVLSG